MILRLDPSRTSNDINVACVDAAGEHAVALHALDEHGGAFSSRARDLADLGLIAKQVDGLGGSFTKASRGAPISFDDAYALTTHLVNPRLDGSAAAKTWDAASAAHVP